MSALQRTAGPARGAPAPAFARVAARAAAPRLRAPAARGAAGRTRPHPVLGGRGVAPLRVAAPAAETVAAAAPAGGEGAAEPINWYKQWYPAAILSDLDPSRPTPLKLLGRPLVAWRDGQGTWSVLQDRCPHRLAPLSEGRVEPKTGNLMCAYHGWEFDAGGACTAIPQIGDAAAKARAAGAGRACVAPHPVREAQGLLWVWGDASPRAAAEAAAAPTPTIPEHDDAAGWEPRTGWFMRDVPLSFDTVVENVTDPCHAPFTHHGVQGRRENEQGTVITLAGPLGARGFVCDQEGTTARGTFKAQFGFTAPCLVKYNFPLFGRVMAVYIVPSAMGWTRMITRFYKSKTAAAPRPGLFGLFLMVMEKVEGNRVLEHTLMRNTVLDGDNYVLHLQERALLAEGGPEQWARTYYLPGRFDTGVSSWRSWLAKWGANLPVLPRTPADLGPAMGRREALDRYSQHTQHCPDCKRALARVDAVLPLLAAAAVALLAAAVFAALAGAPPVSLRVAGAAAGGALLGVLHRRLAAFREMFHFVDYVHADKN